MLNFHYYSYQENFLEKVFEAFKDKSVIIFPTVKSKKKALGIYQPKLTFQNNLVLTMLELKQHLFLADLPVVSQEQRQLFWYSILAEQDKTDLNINSFFDSLAACQDFFSFWEELVEECVVNIDFKKLELYSDLAESTLAWQQKRWQLYQKIIDRYLQKIKELNFSDKLQCISFDQISWSLLDSYEQIIFVGQFYYSGLEKKIIQKLSQDKQVSVVYQVPEEAVDEDNLTINNQFIFAENINNEKIKIYECTDQLQQTLTVFDIVEKEKKTDVLVDIDICSSVYKNFFSPKYYVYKSLIPINTTDIYQFIEFIIEILSHKKGNSYRSDILLKWMRHPFIQSKFSLSDAAARYVAKMVDDGRHYVQIHDQGEYLRKFLTKLDAFKGQNDVVHFLKTLNMSDYIQPYYPEIIEKYWLAVTKLEYLINNRFFVLVGIGSVREVFQYFLLIFKGEIRCQFEDSGVKTKRLGIHGLVDVQDNGYRHPVIINVIQGILPRSRSYSSLFSDSQRKLIGLKTYEDFVQQEKYCFYKLVLTAKTANILTIKNSNNNQEPSSFIEELSRRLPSIVENKVPNIENYGLVLEYLYKDKTLPILQLNSQLPKGKGFPADKETISYSQLNILIGCPYRFYLESYIGLSPLNKNLAKDITATTFGKITHKVFELVGDFLLQHRGRSRSWEQLFNDNQQMFKTVINDVQKIFSNKMSYSYNKFYFKEIILPSLLLSIKVFLKFLDNKVKNIFKIMPEHLSIDNFEKQGLPIEFSGYTLKLKARADLRLETQDNKAFIIDYKTGSSAEKKQLDFYELFYYGLRDTAITTIQKYFYYIFEQKMETQYGTKLTKQIIISELEKIMDAEVYLLYSRKSACLYCEFGDICRKDIPLNPPSKGEL